LAVPPTIRAERLPIKVYTTADGLAQNEINRIVRDSRGFLWFCTEDGLSRYDGYSFTNYGVEQGLPDARVRDVLETREGGYWVATGGGLCLFNPKGTPLPIADRRLRMESEIQNPKSDRMFTVYYPGDDARTRSVTRLLQDRSGTIWCGTAKGLFRLDRCGSQIKLTPVDIGLPLQLLEGGWIAALCQDRHGRLWIGAAGGLYRRWADGSTAHYSARDGLPEDNFQSLLEDRLGNLWAGTRLHGLFRLTVDATHQPPVIAANYTIKDGLNSNWVFDTFESSDGRFWIATTAGLCELISSSDSRGRRFRSYPRVRGLGPYELMALAEDQYGNLWMGTNNTGALKLTHSGFTTFGEEDGFTAAASIFENTSGELCLVGAVPGNRNGSVAEGETVDETDPASFQYWRRLGRFTGQRFTWLRPNVPKRIKALFGWGWNQIALQDHAGQWWIITDQGLFRFPRLSRFEHLKTIRPAVVYTTAAGAHQQRAHRRDSTADLGAGPNDGRAARSGC
jgi:ligand-binding sensor domain-containing protein